MIALINTNRMTPPIGPIGLDYVAGALCNAGIQTQVLDLALVNEPDKALKDYFASHEPRLIGLSFRNADDCFWPSAEWFVPRLKDTIDTIKALSDAPIVVGGIGYSIFAESIFRMCNADFGICGDGESAMISLFHQLQSDKKFVFVPGLLWRENGKIQRNPPAWNDEFSSSTSRSFIDNPSYFKLGGQCGIETKRGCNQNCMYCADKLAKGNRLRLRKPAEVADEVQSLLQQGIDVLHICDSEFNLSYSHAMAVCRELIDRRLGDKVRWYSYMLPAPFDSKLAETMSRAGCTGINFTTDSSSEFMLRAYCHKHKSSDIAGAVKLCRENNIAVMTDLLLGGPGETQQSVRETIDFIKKINPDCVGAALGMRIYPGTEMEKIACDEVYQNGYGAIRRKYTGPLDLLKPTFYISQALGENPAGFVRDLIGNDKRFFAPAQQSDSQTADGYNYNDNSILQAEILKGARGAYWDILRKIRTL